MTDGMESSATHQQEGGTTWKARARCRGMDPELFYPTTRTPPETIALALRACKRCPVVEQCTEAGRKELYGIWGGRRVSMRRKLKLRPTRDHGGPFVVVGSAAWQAGRHDG